MCMIYKAPGQPTREQVENGKDINVPTKTTSAPTTREQVEAGWKVGKRGWICPRCQQKKEG